MKLKAVDILSANCDYIFVDCPFGRRPFHHSIGKNFGGLQRLLIGIGAELEAVSTDLDFNRIYIGAVRRPELRELKLTPNLQKSCWHKTPLNKRYTWYKHNVGDAYHVCSVSCCPETATTFLLAIPDI
jgi:hypothetical protein